MSRWEKRRNRGVLAAMACALSLAVGWFLYTRTVQYQISTIVTESPFRQLGGSQDNMDADAIDDYLQGLVAAGMLSEAYSDAVAIRGDAAQARVLAVGREREKPGLVVTLFNIHKPRDRSHYERFAYYHESFYRSVEASSVTPFSPRALDKGLAGALVGLSRHCLAPMTAPSSAAEIVKYTSQLDPVVEAFANRAERQSDLPAAEKAALREQVRARGRDLMNQWANEELDLEKANTRLKYAQESPVGRPLIRDFLDKEVVGLPPRHRWRKFRAGRSLRDVELSSAIFVRTLENVILEDED